MSRARVDTLPPGWAVLAVVGTCATHGCATCDYQTKTTRRLNVCLQCFRAVHRTRSKVAQTGAAGYWVNRGQREGSDVLAPDFWPQSVNRKIKKFWADRGMTEEEARLKFGGRKQWLTILQKARRQGQGAANQPKGQEEALEAQETA